MIRQISAEEAREVIDRCRTGRLGCVDEEGPYVVPVNYAYSGDSLYIHSMPGRKIRALRADPRACLQVDEIADQYNWRSAIAFGKYEEVIDDGERDLAMRLLLTRFPQMTPVESVPVHDGQSSVVIFRIIIEKITGAAER